MKIKQRCSLVAVGMITLSFTTGCGAPDRNELFDSNADAPGRTMTDGAGISTAGAPASPGAPGPSVPPSQDLPAVGMPIPSAPTGGEAETDVEGVATESPPATPAPPAEETSNGEPSAEVPLPPAEEPPPEPEPPPPPCELGDFGPLQKLSGLGLDGPLWGPALSAVDTDLFLVATTGGGAEQIFFASRPDVTSTQFSAANQVLSLASNGLDGTPFVSASGLRIYFYSTREGSNAGSRDIWVAERSTLADAFGAPRPLVELNTSSLDLLPRVSDDELRIVFTSQRPDGRGRTDIWQAQRRAINAPFSAPQNVAELNTDSDDTGAVLSSDELTVYFSSNRAGGQGRLDIWRATRASIDQPFGTPSIMPGVNSPGEEVDFALSSDERELLLSSDRDGLPELFRAVRTCR